MKQMRPDSQQQAWLVATGPISAPQPWEGLSASAQGVAGQLRPAEDNNQVLEMHLRARRSARSVRGGFWG